MREDAVRRALVGSSAPQEVEAQRRAWAVVRHAFEETEVVPRRRASTRPLLAFAAVAAVVAAAISPPGQAVGGWVREAIGLERVEGRKDARPALDRLPSAGHLLVQSRGGVWVVRQNGSKRRLGAYRQATWSPQGLHVAATAGRRLVAMTPEGTVRWTISRPARVHHPAWSPSGYRIAYGAGDALRVVNGDGEPDRRFSDGVVPGAWAWRPDRNRYVLAFATKSGIVRAVDVDTGRVTSSSRPRGIDGKPRGLEWTADGRFLIVRSPSVLVALDSRGRQIFYAGPTTLGPPAEIEAPPRGHVLALVARAKTHSEVVLYDLDAPKASGRRIFMGAGRLGDVEWSPDGRWLLVSWPSADQWIFLPVPRVRKIEAVSDIRREFDPGGPGRGPYPRVSGWCCPPGGR